MGAILSTIKTTLTALKLLLSLSTDLQALLKRASAPPGLPVPNPTRSYWQEDPPFPELVDVRSPSLPVRTDVVIIGSGITAAAVARSLLFEGSSRAKTRDDDDDDDGGDGGLKVVVVEARSLCSGATGRNGGHVRPSPFELFARAKAAGAGDARGLERAAALARFQIRHVEVLRRLCEEEGWDLAECREVETVDLFLDEESREEWMGGVEAFRGFVGDDEFGVEVLDKEGVREKWDVNSFVVGGVSFKALAMWPYRFVVSVWNDLLVKFPGQLSLEMNTPVQAIHTITPSSSSASSSSSSSSSPPAAYEVVTSRGTIHCKHVVHATNAFAAQFIPGLRGKLSGFQGFMSAQRPGLAFPARYRGLRSWLPVYGGAKGFDYVTQRPPSSPSGTPGDLMVGGGFAQGRDGGMAAVGVFDDSEAALDVLAVNHISGIMPALFGPARWGADDARGPRVRMVWSGIVGVTGDMLPFVGRLDASMTGRRPRRARVAEEDYKREEEKEVQAGEWISAGYCGDGMVWAWLSGTALGLMILGREDEVLPEMPGRPAGRMKDWFPGELMLTPRRLSRAGLENLAGILI